MHSVEIMECKDLYMFLTFAILFSVTANADRGTPVCNSLKVDE